MKRRVQRGLALLLTLCLLSGNIAFAEELPAQSTETSIREETPVQNEESLSAENEAEVPEENEAEVPEENGTDVPEGNEENAPAEAEGELEVSPENAPEALGEGAPQEGENLLSFTINRLPYYTRFEHMPTVYEDYWKEQPQVDNPVYNFQTGRLKDFEITYTLHYGESSTITKKIKCEEDELELYLWNTEAKFEGINIPYADVEVEYYADQGEDWVEPYLLQYNLYLEKGDGKMILKVPKLRPSLSGVPSGKNQILQVYTKITTLDTLYLNGETGNDNNEGIEQEQPLKTFAKAKEIASTKRGIKQIVVTGETPLTGEISLAGTSATVKRGDDYKDYLFYVPAGEKVSLSDIVIDGNATLDENADKKIKQSLIELKPKAILEIKDGAVLRNNAIMRTYSYKTWGGAIYADQATVVMTGGVVEGNQATYGGGIYLSHSTLEFSGGTVQDNHSLLVMDFENDIFYSAGGGICADKGSTIRLSGNAQIRNNHAAEIGGGISLGTDIQQEGNTLDMRGGTIEGNTAGSGGGGVFVQCRYDSNPGSESKAFISAGQIINNKMTGTGDNDMRFGGGGIYVNGSNSGKNAELHLTNAIIANNNAKGSKKYDGDSGPDAGSGGGYAACPITNTTIYVNDGVAIYENEARSSGKDLYILAHNDYKQHSGEPDYDLSLRMLGGAPWNWEYDRDGVIHVGGNELPLEKYKGTIHHNGTYDDLPLLTPFTGNDWVKKLAKVWITGNTSETRGGGIGSNGDVIFGTEGKTVDIRVKKKWDDNNNAKKIRPDSITVELIATYEGQEHVVETRVLNAANEWKTEFKKLPTVNADKEISYSVREAEVKGYDYTVTGNAEQGFTITNTPEIERIDIPVEKIWEDQGHESKRPVEILVTLYANGVKTEKTIVLNQENGWKGVFKGLPKQEEGKTILYKVEEVKVAGYDSKITGNEKDGFVITNTPETPPPTPREKTVEIPVEKIWKDDGHEDKRPTEITVTLYADGVATEKTLILSAANEWKGVFRNLPEKKDGKAITYTVKEVEVKGYESVRTGNMHDGFTLTNTYKPEKPPTPPTPPKPPIPAIPFVRIPRAGA